VAEEKRQFVIFKLGEETFGIPLEHVIEVIKKEAITDVPRALDFVEGIIHIRNRVIPVVDLKKRFKIEAENVNEVTADQTKKATEKIIITSINKKFVGFVVDEVFKVISIDAAAIEKPSTGQQSGKAYVTGIANVEDKLIVLIDSSKILSTEEQHKIKNI
jgi:purine-binding chemotaxis protein CheW